MSDNQSTSPDLVSELRALLAGKVASKSKSKRKGNQTASSDSGESAPVTSASLKKLTQSQLADAAKKLGLSPPAKIKKDALVQLVFDAWHTLVAPAAGAASGGPADDDHTALSHKFEVGEPGRGDSEESRQALRGGAKEIPWGYGRDRVTAMPIDPDRLFAYWEVLDESIAKARTQLGRGGPGAWLNLRVHDTTGRIFDGTNAHSFFDHRVERGDRQWFFPIGKPTSDLIVEMGMKSDEGYFVKIARSGRVEFPRREPAGVTEPEWLTVRLATGQMERGAARPPGRPAFHSVAAPAAAEAGGPGPTHQAPWEDAVRVATGGAERHEWEEVHGQAAFEAHRTLRWEDRSAITSWESGPFPYPVEVPEPVREAFAGKTRVFRLGGRTHVVYGPWHVVIRGLGAEQARVVVSRWEVYRSWAEVTGHAVQEFASAPGGVRTGSSEWMVGSSERRWIGGSEARLGGSSEIFFLKASETRLGGASERMYAGASELVARGSSERLGRGANERRFLGASEGRLGGASPASTAAPMTAPDHSDGSGAAPPPARAAANAYPPPPDGPRPGSGGGSSSHRGS